MNKSEINKDNIIDYYNERYGGTYREDQKGLELYRVKQIVNEIPTDIENILDYGCGQGIWIKVLSGKFLNPNIYGIDISEKAVELAKFNFPQYNFSSFNGETAPFDDNSFELIYSYHVLEHVYDIQKTILDISRLVKKDGYLLIILPCGNDNSLEERVTRLIQNGKETSTVGGRRFFYEDPGHLRRMKSEELIKSFSQYNINIYKEFYSNQFWGAIGWIGRTSPAFISDLFIREKGTDKLAKLQLLLLKIIFLVLTNPLRLYKLNLRKKICSEISMLRKIAFTLMIPLKIIVAPFGLLLDLLSFLEWYFYKRHKNGSAQYLIFKKG